MLVDDIVKDHQAQVGHAQIVNIGKSQSHLEVNLVPIFNDLVVFSAVYRPGFATRGRMRSRADSISSAVLIMDYSVSGKRPYPPTIPAMRDPGKYRRTPLTIIIVIIITENAVACSVGTVRLQSQATLYAAWR